MDWTKIKAIFEPEEKEYNWESLNLNLNPKPQKMIGKA